MDQEARRPPPENPEPRPEGSPWDAGTRDAPAGHAASAAESEAQRERERWLRRRFETEHEVLLSMMRLLVSGVSREGRAMRFWRWLIDDFRSERRLLASLNGSGRPADAALDSRRVLWWFRRREASPDVAGPGREQPGRG